MEQPKPIKPVVCRFKGDNLTVYHTAEAAEWVREQMALFCYAIIHRNNRAVAFILQTYAPTEVAAWLESGYEGRPRPGALQ